MDFDICYNSVYYYDIKVGFGRSNLNVITAVTVQLKHHYCNFSFFCSYVTYKILLLSCV
jgi:hypothetical protein